MDNLMKESSVIPAELIVRPCATKTEIVCSPFVRVIVNAGLRPSHPKAPDAATESSNRVRNATTATLKRATVVLLTVLWKGRAQDAPEIQIATTQTSVRSTGAISKPENASLRMTTAKSADGVPAKWSIESRVALGVLRIGGAAGRSSAERGSVVPSPVKAGYVPRAMSAPAVREGGACAKIARPGLSAGMAVSIPASSATWGVPCA